MGICFCTPKYGISCSISPTEESAVVNKKLSKEEKATLQSGLKEFEATLSNSPKGAAVTLAELGEYARAASLLDDLTKCSNHDVIILVQKLVAVQLFLAYREHPNPSSENLSQKSDSNPTDSQNLDPVQVELLLGKAYSDWAMSVML
ncbi:hypothetical protein Fmac_025808 [Flemingia macrophylla]|uniref:Uncharacterized protein n=1 Tax=Flemingia macrophylla TaxID=520843 RepID=A0ABD1LD30_9FABA